MLLTLLAWIYISFLCLSWGLLCVRLISRLYQNIHIPFYGYSATCFIGLAGITVIAQLCSLFTGLGGMAIQLIFLLPAVCTFLFLEKPGRHVKQIQYMLLQLHPVTALLLSGTLLMILVMSVSPMIHPDTIAYHFQSIRWAAEYPAVPGLANINYLYGFQNSWFLLCALFSFSFTGTNAITFINTTVLAWLLFFLIQQINTALKRPGGGVNALLWLLMLLVNIWSYTQIRLTATSGSPDFIATIYVLLTVYLYLEFKDSTKGNDILVIFLCVFTLTIKLSVFPVILLAIYLLYPFNMLKTVSFLVLLSLIIVPYVTRNIITSGHPLFPLAFPDIVDGDWKYSTEKLERINKYILAYARTRDNSTEPAVLLAMPYREWLQKWWQQLYLSDKVIIALQFFSVAVMAFNGKRIFAGNAARRISIAIVLSGLLFWFIKAPDPRFGMGFLLLLPSLVLPFACPGDRKGLRMITPKLIIFICLLSAAGILSYTAYRFKNYFKLSGFFYPAGFAIPYQSVYYREINKSIPLIIEKNKNIIIISAPDSARRHFNFRGKTAAAGFSLKK